MKKTVLTLIAIIPLFCLAAPTLKTTPKPSHIVVEKSMDKVVAIVNDEIITQSELNNMVSSISKKMLESQRRLPSETVLRKTVLDQLINKSLQLQIAKRNDITIAPEEMQQAIKRIMQQNHFDDRKELLASLKHEGMTYTDFESQLRDTLLVQKIQGSALGAKVKVSEKDIAEVMKQQQGELQQNRQYHLSHILIPLPDEPTTAQLQKTKLHASQIYRKAVKSSDFEKLASENSSTNALEGGDLGWRKVAELPTLFTQQLKHMKTNDVVGPLKAPNGFHIIKLLGQRNSGEQASKAQIRNYIFQRKMAEQVEAWLKEVRNGAYVKVVG